MPSRYHPIEDGLWDDPKFDAIGDLKEAQGVERGFFAFLSTNKMQRPAGIYRATDEEIAAASRLPVKQVKTYLVSLHRRRLIVRDGAWVFIPGYWKRQAHNPGMTKAARFCLESCSSRAIRDAFIKHYPLHREWLTDGCGTVEEPKLENAPTEPMQLQNQNQNQNQNHNPSPRQLPEEAVWGCPEALALKYNRETPNNCPAVTTLSRGRRDKATRYLRLFPDESWWTAVFQQYHRSRFLSGKSQPGDGHKSFQPDFDWLLSAGKDGVENCVKVHDGRYADGR